MFIVASLFALFWIQILLASFACNFYLRFFTCKFHFFLFLENSNLVLLIFMKFLRLVVCKTSFYLFRSNNTSCRYQKYHSIFMPIAEVFYNAEAEEINQFSVSHTIKYLYEVGERCVGKICKIKFTTVKWTWSRV